MKLYKQQLLSVTRTKMGHNFQYNSEIIQHHREYDVRTNRTTQMTSTSTKHGSLPVRRVFHCSNHASWTAIHAVQFFTFRSKQTAASSGHLWPKKWCSGQIM